MKFLNITLLTLLSILLEGCGSYSFTGGDTGNAKTIQIGYFVNNAELIEPTLSQEFTLALQDLFLKQTNLSLVKVNGDIQFEGEIVDYTILPMSATANQTAAQNRLSISINVRYHNKLKEADDFEQIFKFYFDYPAGEPLVTGSSLMTEAFEVIFTRITQDIFNASIGNW